MGPGPTSLIRRGSLLHQMSGQPSNHVQGLLSQAIFGQTHVNQRYNSLDSNFATRSGASSLRPGNRISSTKLSAINQSLNVTFSLPTTERVYQSGSSYSTADMRCQGPFRNPTSPVCFPGPQGSESRIMDASQSYWPVHLNESQNMPSMRPFDGTVLGNYPYQSLSTSAQFDVNPVPDMSLGQPQAQTAWSADSLGYQLNDCSGFAQQRLAPGHVSVGWQAENHSYLPTQPPNAPLAFTNKTDVFYHQPTYEDPQSVNPMPSYEHTASNPVFPEQMNTPFFTPYAIPAPENNVQIIEQPTQVSSQETNGVDPLYGNLEHILGLAETQDIAQLGQVQWEANVENMGLGQGCQGILDEQLNSIFQS